MNHTTQSFSKYWKREDLISVGEVCLSVAKHVMVEDLCFEVCRVRNGAFVQENDQRIGSDSTAEFVVSVISRDNGGAFVKKHRMVRKKVRFVEENERTVWKVMVNDELKSEQKGGENGKRASKKGENGV
ncbi:protein LOW PSII ACCUMULATION 1 [Pyrus ussuriensis x Pyrus communis]|uniref:Protein LOW PSII ACCUMULATION 1 n=1 Tax=Pyrus ussuriensis x Pyrus communis TaxID=2448454 RepID=A0A5N5ID14_9ROSA|nr:protein LOW PSII ACCUMULATION 1 [Pyrus ussuriensis x Pyrus communis]